MVSGYTPMVVYEDYATGNVYRFLTNDFTHSYLTIAELFIGTLASGMFLQMDQATSEHQGVLRGPARNAVYSQIWIAICDYLLFAIARKMFHIDPELCILSSVVGKVLSLRKPLKNCLLNQNVR